MKTITLIGIVWLCLMAAACAPTFVKVGASAAQQEEDHVACYEAMTERWHWTARGVWALETYYSCLEQKGYRMEKAANGDAIAPKLSRRP